MKNTARPNPLPCGRRHFLAATARAAGAALVGPWIIPGTARGAGGRLAPGNRITMGLIGTGRQGLLVNLPALLHEHDVQVVAVCDVDRWRVDQARAKTDAFYAENTAAGAYKGCAVYRDFRDLLARDDIDAVMISTPDHWHVPMAMAAARAGKDILCEKPLARNIAEGRRLADLVAQRKLVFRIDSEFRFNPRFHQAAQLVRNGRIGRLTRILTAIPTEIMMGPQPEMPVPPELDYDLWLGPAPFAPYTEHRVHPRMDTAGRPGWICIRDYADGLLATWGAHLNDIAMWANDTERTGPIEIEGTGKFPPPENLWNTLREFSVDMKFANGVVLTCRSAGVPSLRFEGTDGWIELPTGGRITASRESLPKWKPGPNDLSLPFKPTEKRDFLDAVKTRGQTLCDAECGHRVSSLVHLGLAAILLGRKLRWDPVNESAVGDDAAARRLLEPAAARSPWREIAQ
jgi:predicted dehydrogenase